MRKTEYRSSKLFSYRWSPRAMTGEAVTDEELMALFEAARWAPSAYNAQPWRFLYAKKGTEEWDLYFDLLVDFNKQWCKNADVLVVVASKRIFNHNKEFSKTHSYDTGAAWQNLALQGSFMGLVVHGMSGFDYEKARLKLDIPDEYEVLAMIAIGRHGNKDQLPEELQKRESPSDRKPVEEYVFKGRFKL